MTLDYAQEYHREQYNRLRAEYIAETYLSWIKRSYIKFGNDWEIKQIQDWVEEVKYDAEQEYPYYIYTAREKLITTMRKFCDELDLKIEESEPPETISNNCVRFVIQDNEQSWCFDYSYETYMMGSKLPVVVKLKSNENENEYELRHTRDFNNCKPWIIALNEIGFEHLLECTKLIKSMNKTTGMITHEL